MSRQSEDRQLEFETAFRDGEEIPKRYSGYGEDLSPEFRIHNLSAKAKSLVIILEDLSHPIKNFTHWIAWNISAEEIIPEDVASVQDIVQGIGYGFHRYAGPKPPKGRTHDYRYSIYALDDRLDLSSNTMKKKLLRSMEGHILQSGSIIGCFTG